MNNNTRFYPRTLNQAFPKTSEYSSWSEGPYSRTKTWVWAAITILFSVGLFLTAAFFSAA